MTSSNWRKSSSLFFDQRAHDVRGDEKNLKSLCYVSGRDVRLWSDQHVYDDMIFDIVTRLGADKVTNALEVGCASGFLAWGLAPKFGKYTGVDVAAKAVQSGKKLGLKNTEFKLADGTALPFDDGQFDVGFSYDVFTNFPEFGIGEAIIRELLRVVKPGGRILIGSIPDADTQEGYVHRVGEVSRELEEKYGPPVTMPIKKNGIVEKLRSKFSDAEPGITCYYFSKKQFSDLASSLGVGLEFFDIHALNPYKGYRFNAVFIKPE